MSEQVSFLEILRAGWPVVVFTLGALWAAAVAFTDSRQTKMELADTKKNFKEDISRVEETFMKFKDGDYKDDKRDILAAIDKVGEMHRVSEKRLEDKLDKIQNENGNKLDKVTDLLNSLNVSLAELRGRPYPKHEEKRV